MFKNQEHQQALRLVEQQSPGVNPIHKMRSNAIIKWLSLALLIVPLLTLIGIEAGRGTRESQTEAGVALGLMLVGTLMVAISFHLMRKTDQERARDDQHFVHFMEGVGEYAIYMLDTLGHVASWNAGAMRLKGYTRAEIAGEHFSRFFTEDDRASGVPDAALLAAARDGNFEHRGWRLRKDGSRFPAVVAIRAVRDAGGRLLGFAEIARDNSERLQHEQTLKQTRAALAQSQKMETLGKLSGGVAHDFNNLLHVIRNCVEVLQRVLPPEHLEAMKMLDVIRRNADRAARLTHRLLAFSRLQPFAPKPVNLNKMVAGVYELLQQTLGDNVELALLPGEDLGSSTIDANQLEIAILNLAVNARDAMPHGGKLTIETSNAVLDAGYASEHGALAGQYILIAVRDNGVGMTQDVIDKAFEPFFTTKEEGRGTGLGLSQVYGFIQQCGGHVRLCSQPGVGTTVKLYLPRTAGDPYADAATADGNYPPVR